MAVRWGGELAKSMATAHEPRTRKAARSSGHRWVVRRGAAGSPGDREPAPGGGGCGEGGGACARVRVCVCVSVGVRLCVGVRMRVRVPIFALNA